MALEQIARCGGFVLLCKRDRIAHRCGIETYLLGRALLPCACWRYVRRLRENGRRGNGGCEQGRGRGTAWQHGSLRKLSGLGARCRACSGDGKAARPSTEEPVPRRNRRPYIG